MESLDMPLSIKLVGQIRMKKNEPNSASRPIRTGIQRFETHETYTATDSSSLWLKQRERVARNILQYISFNLRWIRPGPLLFHSPPPTPPSSCQSNLPVTQTAYQPHS